jgi:hypothetical protein
MTPRLLFGTPFASRSIVKQCPFASQLIPARPFSLSAVSHVDVHSDASYSKPAGDLHQGVTKEELSHYDKRVAEDTSKQIRTPWMREGSDRPPVATNRSAGAMTKGVPLYLHRVWNVLS